MLIFHAIPRALRKTSVILQEDSGVWFVADWRVGWIVARLWLGWDYGAMVRGAVAVRAAKSGA